MKRASEYQPYKVLLALWLLAIGQVTIRAEIEICTDGGQHVFQLTHESCPFGVLFMEPQVADCVKFTTEDPAQIMEDICTKSDYKPDKRQFQYFPDISKDELQPGDSCKTTHSSMCNLPTQRIHSTSFLRRVTDVDFTFPDENNSTNLDAVEKQTRHLFQYMIGLGKVDIDDSLRALMLLKKSFDIFKKFGPARYLPHAFWEDVEASFLFLFNEADTSRVQDVTNEEFDTILEHLTYCSDQKNPFVWEGLKCATYSMIQRVRKSGQLFNDFDETNKDAFSKYDVPVEATWGAIDFVHGLCYGTFRDHINSHHLYQQAMERLFANELLYRWKNRFIFQGQQEIWNHFFSTNVKNALMNMDIAIQASYLNTPFLHRLERPIDGKAKRRRRRWAETHALRSFDSIEGYCFQTQEEVNNVLNNAICD